MSTYSINNQMTLLPHKVQLNAQEIKQANREIKINLEKARSLIDTLEKIELVWTAIDQKRDSLTSLLKELKNSHIKLKHANKTESTRQIQALINSFFNDVSTYYTESFYNLRSTDADLLIEKLLEIHKRIIQQAHAWTENIIILNEKIAEFKP